MRAVIAESFEKIHRSNLVGMGILPLQFMEGENAESLCLRGDETLDVLDLSEALKPGQVVRVSAAPAAGATREFKAKVRIDTPVEVEYYRHGGILRAVLRRLAG